MKILRGHWEKRRGFVEIGLEDFEEIEELCPPTKRFVEAELFERGIVHLMIREKDGMTPVIYPMKAATQ